MLALTRKVGEKIIIDDNIIFTIVEVKGETVRVAIDAPRKIKIYRGEIYDTIAKENKMAVAPQNVADLDVLKNMQIPNAKNVKDL